MAEMINPNNNEAGHTQPSVMLGAADRAEPVASAQHQTSVSPEQQLNSANSGLIIQRTGQLKHEFASEGRQFAREMAECINTNQVGVASVFLYEETFGAQDRIHWLIHMKSLHDYEKLVNMYDNNADLRSIIHKDFAANGEGTLGNMFVESSFYETVLIPQRWTFNGSGNGSGAEETRLSESSELYLPPAQTQTAMPMEALIHTAKAGVIIQRTAQAKYGFGPQAREFAREVVNYMNSKQGSIATVFLYEETFGVQERIHWFIQMKSLWDYQTLIQMGAGNEEFRNIFLKERIPSEQGGGKWDKMFVDGSFSETVLIPVRPV